MVKPKTEKSDNWMRDEFERINRDHPVVATRYYVAEITPAYSGRQGDGHGGSERVFYAAESRMVSPHFYKELEDAQAWMDAHEPDDGKELKVYKQTGRQYIHWSG